MTSQKILIIRNDNMGDLVLSTPIFREIKKKFPNSETTALVSRLNYPLIKNNKNIDKTIVLDSFWKRKTFRSFIDYIKTIFKIRKEKFDIGIDLRGSSKNAFFFLFLGNIKKRYSFCKSVFLTKSLERDMDTHETKNIINVAKKIFGIKEENYWPEIATDKKDEEEAKVFIKKNKLKDFVCIYPGANNIYKRWPTEKFDEIIKWMKKNYPRLKSLLIGGKEDIGIIKRLEKNENCISLIDFNLRALSILFKKSKLVIANDGGPMHIAWASGARVLALWGPIKLEHVKPLGNSTILEHKNRCEACIQGDYQLKMHHKCINLISAEEVKKEIKKILK